MKRKAARKSKASLSEDIKERLHVPTQDDGNSSKASQAMPSCATDKIIPQFSKRRKLSSEYKEKTRVEQDRSERCKKQQNETIETGDFVMEGPSPADQRRPGQRCNKQQQNETQETGETVMEGPSPTDQRRPGQRCNKQQQNETQETGDIVIEGPSPTDQRRPGERCNKQQQKETQETGDTVMEKPSPTDQRRPGERCNKQQQNETQETGDTVMEKPSPTDQRKPGERCNKQQQNETKETGDNVIKELSSTDKQRKAERCNKQQQNETKETADCVMEEPSPTYERTIKGCTTQQKETKETADTVKEVLSLTEKCNKQHQIKPEETGDCVVEELSPTDQKGTAVGLTEENEASDKIIKEEENIMAENEQDKNSQKDDDVVRCAADNDDRSREISKINHESSKEIDMGEMETVNIHPTDISDKPGDDDINGGENVAGIDIDEDDNSYPLKIDNIGERECQSEDKGKEDEDKKETGKDGPQGTEIDQLPHMNQSITEVPHNNLSNTEVVRSDICSANLCETVHVSQSYKKPGSETQKEADQSETEMGGEQRETTEYVSVAVTQDIAGSSTGEHALAWHPLDSGMEKAQSATVVFENTSDTSMYQGDLGSPAKVPQKDTMTMENNSVMCQETANHLPPVTHEEAIVSDNSFTNSVQSNMEQDTVKNSSILNPHGDSVNKNTYDDITDVGDICVIDQGCITDELSVSEVIVDNGSNMFSKSPNCSNIQIVVNEENSPSMYQGDSNDEQSDKRITTLDSVTNGCHSSASSLCTMKEGDADVENLLFTSHVDCDQVESLMEVEPQDDTGQGHKDDCQSQTFTEDPDSQDITDSQLCAADDPGEPLQILQPVVPRSRPQMTDGTKLVVGLVRELSSLNMAILRMKREIETARRNQSHGPSTCPKSLHVTGRAKR